jgi:hypothetical protein
MYEHRKQPLLSLPAFLRRLARHAGVSVGIVLGSLAIGVIGYHTLEGPSWIDSLLDAAMILGGMGPVHELHTAAGKVFASAYALYSGLVFLVAGGVLLAPIFHRLLHQFHLEEDEDN